MTVERMIELLEVEKECVLRNASGECNRYCAGCDLLQDDTELHEMYTEAIALLKAQEPRVMSVEELVAAQKMPVWRETKRAHKDLYNSWMLAYDIQRGQGITGTRQGMTAPNGRIGWYKLDDYGITWRCWTQRPSEEQREEVNWND